MNTDSLVIRKAETKGESLNSGTGDLSLFDTLPTSFGDPYRLRSNWITSDKSLSHLD